MRVLESLAIVVTGGLIAGAILYTERFQILSDATAYYLVHDTWTGDLAGCSLAGPPRSSADPSRRYAGDGAHLA
jgi:hypothetical protein